MDKISRVQIGQRYGRLIVHGLLPDRKNPKAKCLCDCGKVCLPQRGALKNGRATSCGCRKREEFIARVKSHGMSKTRTYGIWAGMLARCTNNKLLEYPNYGGRGIQVKWPSFEEFYADMGESPKGFWIDRIDNDGHYEKGNCRWVSPKENQKNKRVSKIWKIKDKVYDSSVGAAIDRGVGPSVIIRGCNGYYRKGVFHKPRDGWSSELKY